MMFGGASDRMVRTAKMNISPEQSYPQSHSRISLDTLHRTWRLTYKEFCTAYRCSIYFQAYTEKIIHSYLDESCSNIIRILEFWDILQLVLLRVIQAETGGLDHSYKF